MGKENSLIRITKSTKGNSMRIKQLVLASFSIAKENCMRVTLLTTNPMALENRTLTMVPNIQVNSIMAKSMGMDTILGKMGLAIKVSGRIMSSKGMGSIVGVTVEFM